MGRTHTALEYKAIIRKLRAARPDIQISSDFIVGFPGETTEDFEKTMKLIADVNFDMSYSFIFSARPGKVVRTEDEMGLRVAETPESVIARTRKENDLGVGYYQP